MPLPPRRIASEDCLDVSTDSSLRAHPEGMAHREGGHVIEMQRRRLFTATAEIAFERGMQRLTVATVCERAGLSRKTFYSLYEDRDEFLLAVFEDAVAQAHGAMVESVAGETRWREGVRAGLVGLLEFLDREPGTGRLLIVEALGAGSPTLEARSRVLAKLATILDEGRLAGTGARARTKAPRQLPPLTAEGAVGAVISVIHARMLNRDGSPLTELTNPLMAMIVQPYLGPAAAQKELEQSLPRARATTPRLPADPFKDLPMRLTYRTARALTAIATAPGSSSKQVADAAGITDVGQISKLLSRLKRYELIEDNGAGPAKGLPRAWSLTPRGEGVLQAVGIS